MRSSERLQWLLSFSRLFQHTSILAQPMHSRFEQTRINQLLSPYAPTDPPRLPLDFGDYLSLAWRLDQNAGLPTRVRYYRTCLQAVAEGLHIEKMPVHRLVEITSPGEVYQQLPLLPYRNRARLVDAQDRRAAIAQLISLRDQVLKMGTYQEGWGGGYPGSGIVESEVRERVFAVLFTALQGQFGQFARLLLVIDIVLGNLLLGSDTSAEIALADLIARFDYPDPSSPHMHRDFAAEPTPG